MSRRQNKQLQDRVSTTTSKPGTSQKSVRRSKEMVSQRPGSQLSGTNPPEKSVKSGKQAASHHLERKNSTETRSMLVENESGNGIHHQ